MARHHPDLLMCRKLVGSIYGKVCTNCAGRCIICDSHGSLTLRALICDECDHGPDHNKCLICGATGFDDAQYCQDCVELQEDRDGCPRLTGLSTLRSTMHLDQSKFKKRPTQQ